MVNSTVQNSELLRTLRKDTTMRVTASSARTSTSLLVCWWFCSILIADGFFLHVLGAPVTTTTGAGVSWLMEAAAVVAANKKKAAAAFVPSVAVISRRQTSTRRYRRHFLCFQQGLLQLNDVTTAWTDVAVGSSSSVMAASGNLLDFSSSSSSNWFIWPLRFTSAVLSYVALIGFFDRPRGELHAILDDMIEIKQSNVPGAGLGLFAKVPLPKGTVLGTYPGVLVPLSQNLPKLQTFPACEGYIWRFSDNRYVIDPTNAQGEIEDACRFGGNPSLPGSIWICRNIIPLFLDVSVGTALCRINEPPRGRDVNVVTNEDQNSRTVTFMLERDVWPDEEFYIDYGLSYDRSRYGGDGGSVISDVGKNKKETD